MGESHTHTGSVCWSVKFKAFRHYFRVSLTVMSGLSCPDDRRIEWLRYWRMWETDRQTDRPTANRQADVSADCRLYTVTHSDASQSTQTACNSKQTKLDIRPDCSLPGYPPSRLLVLVNWLINWFACVHRINYLLYFANFNRSVQGNVP